MKIIAVSGKGGVGKSFISGSNSAAYANQGDSTAIIDCDKKGAAIIRGFSLSESIKLNSKDFSSLGIQNLCGSFIAGYKFDSIIPKKDRSPEEFVRYMEQFPGPYGLVAFQDMIRTFFGGFTQPKHAAELICLSELIGKANLKGIENLVLDLEPTKGALALLDSTKAVSESIVNLSMWGSFLKTLIGTKMPDVRGFLESEYMQKAKIYSDKLINAHNALKKAKYILVCEPQIEKVDEMLVETSSAIKGFGGEISGYVINNIRKEKYLEKREWESQKRQIKRVQIYSQENGKTPILNVNHYIIFNVDNSSKNERLKILNKTGRNLIKLLN